MKKLFAFIFVASMLAGFTATKADAKLECVVTAYACGCYDNNCVGIVGNCADTKAEAESLVEQEIESICSQM